MVFVLELFESALLSLQLKPRVVVLETKSLVDFSKRKLRLQVVVGDRNVEVRAGFEHLGGRVGQFGRFQWDVWLFEILQNVDRVLLKVCVAAIHVVGFFCVHRLDLLPFLFQAQQVLFEHFATVRPEDDSKDSWFDLILNSQNHLLVPEHVVVQVYVVG